MASDDSAGMTTLLVGLDAACLSVLEPLFEAGDIPTIRSIFDDGISGRLESQIPPWTASAWPSLYTGMNPGKHGVFGFLNFEGYDWEVVNASHVRRRSLWELADAHDLTSVVVNVPVTHPAPSIDGAVIPGYVAPEEPDCHPSGIMEDVQDAVGDYRIYSEVAVESMDAATDDRGELLREFVRTRGEAFRYLSSRFNPDFGFVEFQQTDTVFHEFPGESELVRAVYQEADEQIAAIIEQCDPDNVVVASDHGMGRYTGDEFRVNEFLKDEGFVETAVSGSGMPRWISIREQGPGKTSSDTSRDSGMGDVLGPMIKIAASVGITTQRVASVLRPLGLTDVVGQFVPGDVQRAGIEHPDFQRSRAYMRDRIELGVRINLAGRDPEGTVPQDEYEAVRDQLIDALKSVTTPDGDPVFEDVARCEKYFHGPETENAVDVVTVPAEFDQYLVAQLYGEQFGEPTQSWNHKRFGIVAAQGTDIDDDAEIGSPQLFDIAPTVLSTLGIPRDQEMDGDPLPCVEPTPERAYPSYDSQQRITTDDSAVEDRLSDLGYI